MEEEFWYSVIWISELQLSHHELVWSIDLWIDKEEASSGDE